LPTNDIGLKSSNLTGLVILGIIVMKEAVHPFGHLPHL